LVLNSIVPILLYTIAAELGVDRRAALLAAFAVAAHPFAIVFSGVLERQAAYRFAAFGSILALIGFAKRGGFAAFTAFVLGAGLATTSRPEGAHVLVVALAIVLLLPASRRRRATSAVAIGALVLLSYGYLHALASKPPGDGGPLLDRMP